MARFALCGIVAVGLVLSACSEDPTDKGASAAAVHKDALVADGSVLGDGAALVDGAVTDALGHDSATTDSATTDSALVDVGENDSGPADVVVDVQLTDASDSAEDALADADDAAPGDAPDSASADAAVDVAADVAQLACKTHTDCPESTGLCVTMACVSQLCTVVPVDEGLSCKPGTACVTAAACLSGKCVTQAVKDCGDGNSCTADSCTTATGTCATVATKDDFACDDGTLCTKTATCFQGVCIGKGQLDCDDSDPCTLDACDPKTGICLHPPLKTGAPCDDGNSCSKGETCDAKGQCGGGNNTCKCSTSADCKALEDGDLCNGILYCDPKSGTCLVNPASVVVCDDVATGPCQANLCAPATGKCAVANKPGGAACDDGNPCTTPDECHKGLCEGLSNTCQCVSDFDCKSSQTSDLCAGQLVCAKSQSPAVCVVNYSSKVTCKDDGDTACSKNTCDPQNGACKLVAQPNGSKCSDGEVCTVADACLAGKCKPGSDTCACTQDSDCAKLEDGNQCNGALFCNLGSGKCDVDLASVVTCPTDKDTVCAAAACQSATGKCELLPRNDGAKCDDDNSCTTDDACVAGKCLAKTNTCACTADADCAKLEDGDACNGLLYCNLASKECQLNPTTLVTCPTVDDGFCQVSTCITKTGKCQLIPRNDGKTCDADGSACTTPDVCNGGACQAGPNTCQCQSDKDCGKFEADDLCSALYCDLLLNQCKPDPTTAVYCAKVNDTACATNTCDIKTGKCAVVPRNQGLACDADGTNCTKGDACDAGKCGAGLNVCQCQVDKDCAALEDGDPCNGTLVCSQAKTCVVDPSTVVTCQNAGDDNPSGEAVCKRNQCDAKTGKCAVSPANPNTICGKGTLCFEAPACDASGGCKQGKAIPCDDGSTCTTQDLCVKGVCTGQTKVCDGGTPCTNASCHPLKGCEYEARKGSCSDGDKCSVSGECVGLQCVGVPLVCGDNNPCTTDGCVKGKGCVFTNNTATCNDGNLCTQKDACAGGSCVGLPLQTTVDCDDSNVCTYESCDSKVGCTHQPVSGPCQDDNLCKTGDTCIGGACKGGDTTKCDDGNHCTKNVCDNDTGGCTHSIATGSECSDGNPCTTPDACSDKGVCVAGKLAGCDDGKPCTKDACDPTAEVVCTHAPLSGGSCDDGNLCTENDVCVKGDCTGSKKACTEGTLCTIDSCHPTKGCSYQTLVGACDDGDACTTADTCKGKACVGATLVCDDKNPCTTDSCNKTSGCLFLNNAATCDDGDKCTVKDACLNGSCAGKPLATTACSDGNSCTDDSCDKVKGCVSVHNTASCEDGYACSSGDTCKLGVCISGTTSPCTDDSPCTTDYCSAIYGCTYVKLKDGTACEDANPCTVNTACKAGKCEAAVSGNGGVLSCDDKNPCTSDLCSVTAGCTHSPAYQGSPCSDGKPCTGAATCQSGTCTKTKDKDCDDHNACTTTKCVLGKGCETTAFAEGSVCASGDSAACTTAGICKSGVCEGALARPWVQSVTGTIRSCRSVIAHSVSGYLLTGRRDNGTNWEAAWARVQFNGALVWTESLPSKGDARLLDASSDGDDTMAAVGSTKDTAASDADGLFIRIDGLGKIAAKQVFALGTKDDELWGVATESSGGHVLVGRTWSKGLGGSEGWLIRLDKDDKVVVNVTHGTFTNDALNDVTVLSDGTAVAVGEVGFYGGWIATFDAKGALLKQVYDGSEKADEQHYQRIRRLSDDVLYVTGSQSLRTFNSKLELQTAPKINGSVDDFIARPKGGFARTYNGATALLGTKYEVNWTTTGNPGGGRRTLLAPDEDSLLILGEDSCGLVRTDAFGSTTCAESGACREKTYTDCVDNSLCTQGDTCKAGKCAVTNTVVCDDKNACTQDACVATTGKCGFTKLTGTACSSVDSACSVAGKCDAGTCFGDSVLAWTRTFLPFYGCCGDNNNGSNEYQGTRLTAVAPRDDGQIFTAGPAYNRQNVNAIYGKLLHGTGGTAGKYDSISGARYSFYDRKDSTNDAYADEYNIYGAVSFKTLTSCALARYRYWTFASNKWSSVYFTKLMPNASNGKHLTLGDKDTVPVAMAPFGDNEQAFSLAKHKVAGAWTHTVFVTRHALSTWNIGQYGTPSLVATWSHKFGDNDEPAGIDADAAGGAVVGGRTYDNATKTWRHVVARVGSDGKLKWSQPLAIVDDSVLKGIGWTQGGAVVTGQKRQIVSGTATYFVWLRRYDADGVLKWDRLVAPAPKTAYGFKVMGRSVGFAVGAWIDDTGSKNALLRVSELGHVIGDRRFGNTIYDWAPLADGYVGVGYKQTGSSYQNKWKQYGVVVRTDLFGNASCDDVGSCKTKAFADCDDGNACTTDTCDGAKGCVHASLADKLACADDGKICTLDYCSAGECSHPADKDGLPCESDGQDCTGDLCKSGVCGHAAAADGVSCEDGQPCTEKDTCKSGKCSKGSSLAQYTACSDGSKCTKNGKCDANGLCRLSPVCNDGDACTADTCATDGACSFAAMKTDAACDDGDYCTENTACDASGACVGGTFVCIETVVGALPMDCTTDTTGWTLNGDGGSTWAIDGTPSDVKPHTGACTLNFNDGTKYSGNAFAETPHKHGPKYLFGQLKLRWWSYFHADLAAEADHETRTVEVFRGFSRRRTVTLKSSYDLGKWVQLETDLSAWRNSGPNGNFIRWTFAKDGDINVGKGWFVDDVAYVHQVHPKGEPCVFDNQCNDSDQCTKDACVAGYCQNVIDVGGACSDGTACTLDDVCTAEGACVAAKTLVCEDDDVCTDNACHKNTGCYFPGANAGASCDDGDACTASSVCDGGQCYAKTGCDDHNPCTTDACGSGPACSHSTVADGGLCGGSGVCVSGSCVAPASGWASAIAGKRLMCALLAGGKRACWGYGNYGLPTGAKAPNTYSPTTLPGLSNVQAIALANYAGFALHTDGTVSSWGASSEGVRGDGTSSYSPSLLGKIAGLTGVRSVHASSYTACAVKKDGTAWCWGHNFYGQIGDDSKTSRAVPTKVEGLTNVATMGLGERATCAALVDGTVTCWGNNAYGQLGDNSMTERLKPQTKVSGLTDVVQLANNFIAPCALKKDGSVYCWGFGADTGDGTSANALVPVLVKGSK